MSGAIIELHICDDDGKTTSSELPSIINITSNLTKQSLEKMQSQSNKRKRNEKNKNKNLNLMSVSFALSQFESPVSTTYADQSTSIEINSTETPSKINEYEQSLPTPMTDTEQSPIAITSTPTARSKRRNRNKNKLNSSAISDQPNKVNPLGTPILRSSSGTNQRDISKASGFLPSVPLSTNKSSDKTHFRFVSSSTDGLNKFSSSAGNGADNVDVSASGSSVTSVEILTPYLSSSLPYELIKGSGSNGCNDNSSGSGGYSVSDDLLSMLENRKKQLTS